MANIIKRVWNQNRMVQIEDLRGMTFQAEAAGHTFQISGIDDDGNTVALTGTPSGVLLRPDNTDVALTCSVSGGVVSATLPANCYDVPGRFGLTIFITSGSSKTAIYAAVGTVTRTSSGTVAPGTSQSVVDLINAINAAVNSIPANYSALLADIAPTYSNSALYSVGQYALYDGDLKRCIVPITTAESYTAAHWTSAVLGQDVSDLKSALYGNPADTSSVTVEEHKFVNALTGGVEGWETAPYAVSDLIDISDFAGLAVYITAEYYGTAGAAFYNAAGTFISGKAGQEISTPSQTPQTIYLTVPKNAKYARITLNPNNLNISNYPIVCCGSLPMIRPLIDSLCDDYQEVLKGGIDLSNVNTLLHSIVRWDTGAVETIEGFKYICSDFIPIGALQGVTITFLCTVIGTAGAAFYNIEKEFISGFGTSDVTTPSTTPQTGSMTVPSGAAYFRFTGYDTYSTDADDYPITFSAKLRAVQSVLGVQKLVEKTQQSIDTLESAINGLKNLEQAGSAVFPLSTLSVFERFGVIGDSYASGEIITSQTSGDFYNLSWGQNIARMCGTTCINFSKGGLTTKTWLTDNKGLPLMLAEDPQQLYFVCLGLNDQTAINQGTYSVGSEADLKSDYTQNPDTFYGNYGRIIGNIKAHAPNAKIIICSVTEGQPTDFATVNAAIPVIASHFSLPYINLRNDPFFTSAFYRDSLNVAHPVAVSYGGYALGIMRLFSKCAVDYLTYFKDYVG